MLKRLLVPTLSSLVILIALLVLQPHVARAQGAVPPQPLPHNCGGVSPIDEPEPACCAYGYVYDNGAPIWEATVTVRSGHGVVTTTTAAGAASNFPYYQVDLSSPPLNVVPGDQITVTAFYSGRNGVTTQTVVGGGQQVDNVVLTSGVDLTIQSIVLDPPEPAAGQPLTVTVNILNQGVAASGSFTTFVYVDPVVEPPTSTTMDTSYTYIFGLNAAQFYTWSVLDVDSPAACHKVYAWVDKENQVEEAREDNNVSSVTTCLACQSDAFEEDDACAQAVALQAGGAAQRRTFCPTGDADWIRFDAAAGATYTITAAAVGNDAKLVLSLYDACGAPASFGTGARIVWPAPTTQAYYVKAQHHDGQHGPDTRYDLSLAAQSASVVTKTLILVNRARVQTLYGAQAADALMAGLQRLAGYATTPGLVVQVEDDPTVAAAYAQWLADPRSTGKANAVTDAVRALLMRQLDAHPQVEFVVIVGDDRVIPFHRTPDRTDYPESNYAGSVTPNTTLHGAVLDDMTLTDDFYVDRTPTQVITRTIYLPDYAVGRLVQTPDEIVAQIDTFLAGDQLTVTRGLVSGYDFVQDAAQSICTTLGTDLGTDAMDCALIGSSWSAADLRTRQLNALRRFDVQGIDGHANHRAQGSPAGSAVTADEIATGGASDLSRAVVFTLGCHSGFNDVGDDTPGARGLDLAQAYGRRKVLYVANTGYGWGSRVGMALSERLMDLFALELMRGTGTTVGSALRAAKTRYVAQDLFLDEYDEKILMEAALFGIPMVRVMSPEVLDDGTAFPSVTVTVTAPLDPDSSPVRPFEISLENSFSALSKVSTNVGNFYSLDGHVTADSGTPMQPLFYTVQPGAGEGRLHGAVMTGGTYTVLAPFDPVVVQAVNEYHAPPEPALTEDRWYPVVPWAVSSAASTTTAFESLVAVLGQYHPRHGERLYDGLSFDLYYADSDDWTPATVTTASQNESGLLQVAAQDASGIDRVAVAYTDGTGIWRSVDLVYDSGPQRWLTALPAGAEWLVQAVDGAGNVGFAATMSNTIQTEKSVYLPVISKDR